MRRLLNKKGQALVEFALMIPVLLLIVVGIMEFALILSNQMILENASRECARYAVLGASDSQIQDYLGQLTSSLNGPDAVGTITPKLSSRIKGIAVTIKVTYDYPMMTPIIGNLLGNDIKLTSVTTMRME